MGQTLCHLPSTQLHHLHHSCSSATEHPSFIVIEQPSLMDSPYNTGCFKYCIGLHGYSTGLMIPGQLSVIAIQTTTSCFTDLSRFKRRPIAWHGRRAPSNLVTPEERSLRSRIGAYALHARHDAKETTKAARKAFMAKFELEVDPDSVLPVMERRRRAAAARKEYFTRLAYRSSRSRKKLHQKKPILT